MKQILIVSTIILVCIATIFIHLLYLNRIVLLPNWWIRYLESSQNLIEMQIPTEKLTKDHLYYKLINNSDYSYGYGWGHKFFIRDGLIWRLVTHEGIGISSFISWDSPVILHSNSYVDVRKNLSSFDHLPYGEYVIIKDIFKSFYRTRLIAVGRFTLESDS
ncbi:MAG: hypothetical protein FWC91_05925 [Defluviitaleaceae bacterium]|nr:hypothetical protein [Defluviitaleaceae bacterium]